MKLYFLDNTPKSTEIGDVCGIDGKSDKLVSHIALSGKNINVKLGSDCRVSHTRPPLRINDISNQITFFIPVSAFLDPGQKKNLERFLEKTKQDIVSESLNQNRSAYQQYVIYPSKIVQTNPVKLTRYSCAGFVLDGFYYMGITLLDEKSNAIPLYNLEEIASRHPGGSFLLQEKHKDTIAGYGLIPQNAPWAVIFPGYVVRAILHWISQKEKEIQMPQIYTVQRGDEYLP